MPGAPIYLFEGTVRRDVHTATDALTACASLGGDIMHYIPKNCKFSDLKSTDIISHEMNLQIFDSNNKITNKNKAIHVVCQRKF